MTKSQSLKLAALHKKVKSSVSVKREKIIKKKKKQLKGHRIKGTKETFQIKYRIKRPYPKKEYEPQYKSQSKLSSILKKAAKYKKAGLKRRSNFSRKYNRSLEKVMRAKGHELKYIRRAKSYTLTGKAAKIEIAKNYASNFNPKTGRYYVEEKGWIGQKKFLKYIRMVKYNAVINHYKDLYGISRKEAQILYREIRSDIGEKVREKLY